MMSEPERVSIQDPVRIEEDEEGPVERTTEVTQVATRRKERRFEIGVFLRFRRKRRRERVETHTRQAAIGTSRKEKTAPRDEPAPQPVKAIAAPPPPPPVDEEPIQTGAIHEDDSGPIEGGSAEAGFFVSATTTTSDNELP